MSKDKPVLLKATVYWAEMNSKNKFSGKYELKLGNLSDAAVEALSEINVEARNKGDEMGHFITCKSTLPIKAKTKDGVEIPSDVLVANGSKAVAMVGSYRWKSGEGYSPTLNKLTITELIEYESTDEELDEEDAL